jgi:hypothetical protein
VLNDGRTFEIVKVFNDPEGLTARLELIGWRGDLRTTDNFFIYGTATPFERLKPEANKAGAVMWHQRPS